MKENSDNNNFKASNNFIEDEDIIYLCGGYEGLKEILKKRQAEKIYQLSSMLQISYEEFLLKIVDNALC